MYRYNIETERPDLFDINMMIAMKVVVQGKAAREMMTDAFSNAVKSHEILNTKVVLDDLGNAYYEACESPGSSIFFCDSSFEDLIAEQEKRRFHMEDGEFIRLFVDDTNDFEMTMCFLMHHLGGDGKSLCYFIESFLRNLSGDSLPYQEIRLLPKASLPKGSELSLYLRGLALVWNRQWKKEKRVFGFDDMDNAYQHFWGPHQTKVDTYTFGEEELKEKLAECKAAGIGFTSYVIAELIKDSTTEQDIGIAVDGRPDGNRNMGNQATGIAVKYQYNQSLPVIDNARAIDKLMQTKLSSLKRKYLVLHFMGSLDPTLVDAINLEYAGTFKSKTSCTVADMLGYGNKSKDLSITNLTRLDILMEYGDFRIKDVLFVPPVVSYGKNVVGLVTANNRLSVAVHRYESNK